MTGRRQPLFAILTLAAITVCGCSVDFGRRATGSPGLAAVDRSSRNCRAGGDAAIAIPDRSRGAHPVVAVVAHTERAGPARASAPVVSQAAGEELRGGAMTLAECEALALQNNPTIVQASLEVSRARALGAQVGQYPNPTLGYFGSQLADAGTDQQGVFVEQEFVRGGKLPMNRQILRHAVEAQAAAGEAQTLRVLTDVRVKYWRALAAQARVALTREFRTAATEWVEIAQRRAAAAEGSQPELLQAQIQLSETALAGEQADIAYSSAIRSLAAVIGVPDLSPTSLSGDLAPPTQSIDWERVLADLRAASPELQTVQANARQACAQWQRERLQSIPNPTIQLGAGVDQATGSGLLNVQVAMPMAVYQANEGNIVAARAAYDKAIQEIARVELALRSRLATVRQGYDTALVSVRKYEAEILPRSEESLALSEELFRMGEIDFVQVFLSRRTYFEAKLRYLEGLSELAQAAARIDGLLLEGGLDLAHPFAGDDSSRERAFSPR